MPAMDEAIEAIVKACAHIVIDHYTFMCKVGQMATVKWLQSMR